MGTQIELFEDTLLLVNEVELEELETIIEKGMGTFVEVGFALMRIRDERLYKIKGYTRFNDYTRERWGFTKQHAGRLIRGAQSQQLLEEKGEPIGSILPKAEFQVRPLTELEPEQQVEVWERAVENADGRVPTEKEVQAAMSEMGLKGPIIPPSTGDEWYTPVEYINSVHAVMDGIDLDPASCEQANRVIQAGKFFTKEDNGLLQDWYGRVFINPPYSQNKIFAGKLLTEFDVGHTTQCILLVGAHAIETQWFRRMWDYVLCFTGHRIKFNTPEGQKIAGNISGSVFVYLGDEQYKFAEEFSQHGFVVKRWP